MPNKIYVRLPDARVAVLVKTDSSVDPKFLVHVKGGGQEQVTDVQTISEQEYNEASTPKAAAKKGNKK